MEEHPKPDERRLKRLKMPFVLRLQRLTAADEWDFVLLSDISTTGARFHTEKRYLEGEVLNLRFYLSGELPVFTCTGEVVRIAELGRMLFFEVALIFIDLSQESVELIGRTLEENRRSLPS